MRLRSLWGGAAWGTVREWVPSAPRGVLGPSQATWVSRPLLQGVSVILGQRGISQRPEIMGESPSRGQRAQGMA